MARILVLIIVCSALWSGGWSAAIQTDPTYQPITATNADQLTPVAMLGRGWINQIAWSPDGNTIAVGSSAGVWLHDMTSFISEPRFLDTQTDTWSIVFSPNGQLLATGGRDMVVRVWDMAAVRRDPVTAVPLYSWRCLENGWQIPIENLSFNPAGTLLACAGDGVTVWDVTSGEVYFTIAPEPDHWGENEVVFSPDGTQLATTGSYRQTVGATQQTGRVNQWDVATGELITSWELADGRRTGNNLAYSPDGSLLIEDGLDVTARDATTGDIVYQFKSGGGRSLHFTSTGDFMITGGQRFAIWNAATGTELATIAFEQRDFPYYLTEFGHCRGTVENIPWQPCPTDYWILSTTLSPDDQQVAIAHTTGQITVWNLASTTQLATLRGYSLGGNQRGGASSDTIGRGQFAFSPTETTLAIGTTGYVTDGGWVELWNTDQLAIQEYLPGSGNTKAIAYSPAGTQLATAAAFSGLRIWDMTDHIEQFTLMEFAEAVQGLAFSPDGARIVSGSNSDGIQVWDTTTGIPLTTLPLPEGSFLASIAYSPRRDWIATGYIDGSLQLWDSMRGDQIGIRENLPGSVRAVVFAMSAESNHVLLAAAGGEHQANGFIQQWIIDIEGTATAWGTPITTPTEVTHVAYSSDGTVLVTGHAFGDVYLWDATTGDLLTTLSANHSAPWTNVAFNADGSLLATGGWDGMIRLWAIPAQ